MPKERENIGASLIEREEATREGATWKASVDEAAKTTAKAAE